MNILIAEDDIDILNGIYLHLHPEGYKIFKATNGSQAIEIFNKEPIDFVILDINMPILDGFKVLEKIRAVKNIPVIMLTARGDVQDKVLCFKLGADDYIEKPFNLIELIARIKAHARRTYNYNQTSLKIFKNGNLELNISDYLFFKNGLEIVLSAKEFKLLELFIKNPGRIFTKKQIFENVWEEIYHQTWADNNIMVSIRNLREKIESNPSKPQIILTIRGIGYRMVKL